MNALKVATALTAYNRLLCRIYEITHILGLPWDPYDDVDFDLAGYFNPDDDETESIEFLAESYNGSKTFRVSWTVHYQCGDSDEHHADIPYRYLWMDDEDLRLDVAKAKEAKEAEERRKNIEAAEKKLATAKVRLEVALKEAEREMRRTEEELKALRGA